MKKSKHFHHHLNCFLNLPCFYHLVNKDDRGRGDERQDNQGSPSLQYSGTGPPVSGLRPPTGCPCRRTTASRPAAAPRWSW